MQIHIVCTNAHYVYDTYILSINWCTSCLARKWLNLRKTQMIFMTQNYVSVWRRQQTPACFVVASLGTPERLGLGSPGPQSPTWRLQPPPDQALRATPQARRRCRGPGRGSSFMGRWTQEILVQQSSDKETQFPRQLACPELSMTCRISSESSALLQLTMYNLATWDVHHYWH